MWLNKSHESINTRKCNQDRYNKNTCTVTIISNGRPAVSTHGRLHCLFNTFVQVDFKQKNQTSVSLAVYVMGTSSDRCTSTAESVFLWRHHDYIACHCPACRTTLIATRFWVVMICPIIKCLAVLEFSFILLDLCLFITIFQFYFELCTYCNILDIYLS